MDRDAAQRLPRDLGLRDTPMPDTSNRSPALLERVHANYRECWRYFARTVPGGAITEAHGVTCTATTVPIAFFNPCFIIEDAPDPEAAIDLARRFYAERGLPWLLRTHGTAAARVGEAAKDAGLIAGGAAPGMLLADRSGAGPDVPGLEIRTVQNLDDLRTFNLTSAHGFGLPVEAMAAWDTPAMLAGPDATFYLGLIDGTPVATSMRFTSHRIAGVYTVSTLAEYRGRGIGAALTWRAALGGKGEGCIASALQASSMGLPVYQRMGYRHVSDYETWDMPSS